MNELVNTQNKLPLAADTAVLEAVVAHASASIMEHGLIERLHQENAAAEKGGNSVFRIGNSLRELSADMATLAVAAAGGAAVSQRVWEIIGKDLLPFIVAQPQINFQGRNNQPPWNADLWTADIGLNLSLTTTYAPQTALDLSPIKKFIAQKCVRPILADWLDDATRIHSLDSMGHNWWSVIVSGAGAMAALLGDDVLAARIAAELSEWAHYPGNVFSRKQPNFGPEGDYIEGFGYAEYGLQNVFIFSHLYPSLKVVPNLITAEQARGLARWLRRSILPVEGGFHSLRFGNIPLSRTVRPEVWHSLAVLAGDEQLLWAAHQARPTPKTATELLLWKQPPNEPPTRPSEPLAIFPTSGVAFLERGTQFVAIRSGEFVAQGDHWPHES